jgi:hypothetical protein
MEHCYCTTKYCFKKVFYLQLIAKDPPGKKAKVYSQANIYLADSEGLRNEVWFCLK